MEHSPYSLTLAGTFYTLEQLRQIDQLPGHPEKAGGPLAQIAFAGRSNVGKSSLINALAGRRQLAKVSATPGKTASVNFYLVSSGRAGLTPFYLVDLPGYGYAQRSKAERDKWGRLIETYLRQTPQLKALAVLLDSRLEPQQSDLEMIAFARAINLPLLPVLTKADKCRGNERAKRQAQWRKLLAGQTPLLTAAASGAAGRIGLDDLWLAMERIISPNPDEKNRL